MIEKILTNTITNKIKVLRTFRHGDECGRMPLIYGFYDSGEECFLLQVNRGRTLSVAEGKGGGERRRGGGYEGSGS